MLLDLWSTLGTAQTTGGGIYGTWHPLEDQPDDPTVLERTSHLHLTATLTTGRAEIIAPPAHIDPQTNGTRTVTETVADQLQTALHADEERLLVLLSTLLEP